MAVRALPERQLVPPPDLPRDVPVGRLLERGDREPVLGLRMESHPAFAERRERGLLQLLHFAPPLHRNTRLDPRLAAVAERDGVPVRLSFLELIVFAKPLEDPLLGLLLGQPGQSPRLVVHPPVGADHGQLREAVVAADLPILRIVARRDLEGARAEVHLHTLVGDHGHSPFDERDDGLLAHQPAVALVIRVHGDGDVGEDRRRTHGRNRDLPVCVCERVAHVRERVVDLDVSELEIRERGQVKRAPVDDPVRAVDPALVPEVNEEPHHGPDVGVVHGEALAPVVQRGADAPELDHDLAAVLVEPFPDERHECFAAEVLARLALLGEVLLDRVLGRDAGVVIAGLEEHVVSLHPARADDRVRERELKRVAEVEVACHIRRRMRDREALARVVRLGVVEALGLPDLLPALFDPVRVVQRLHAANRTAGNYELRSTSWTRRRSRCVSDSRVKRPRRRSRRSLSAGVASDAYADSSASSSGSSSAAAPLVTSVGFSSRAIVSFVIAHLTTSLRDGSSNMTSSSAPSMIDRRPRAPVSRASALSEISQSASSVKTSSMLS